MSALDELAVRSRRLRLASLDDGAVTHGAALLMTMDGTSAEPVEIHLAMPVGSVAAVTTLLDVLDLMRASVTMRASLPLRAAGAALFAAHPGERLLHERAGLDLRLDPEPPVHGDIAAAAAIAADQRAALARRIAERSTYDLPEVERLLMTGGFVDAASCIEAGLADGTT